jgi:CRP-like cAMP-binding protein
MEVEEGKTLTREGASGSEFFVIVDGEVAVTKDGADVRSMGPGDFFGEISLLEDRPRTATVTAKTPLRFFVLTRQNFRTLLGKQPELEKVTGALEERLRTTED